MNRVQVWMCAFRPKTFVISISPVVIGASVAIGQGVFDPVLFLLTLLTALAIQIGTNLANDYFDFVKGADTHERKGFMRVTQAGLVAPNKMKKIMIAVFCIAAICGTYLIWKGGAPLAFLLALSIAFGVLYSGGPFPLSYLGLGEIFAFLFFGPIAVVGTHFLQTGTISSEACIAGLSPGAFSMAFLVINNVRDIEEDRVCGKRTLAVRFGKIFGKSLFLFSILLSLLPVVFFYPSHPFLLLTLLVLFLAIPLLRTMFSYQDPRLLNQLFAKTGRLQWIFTLLFCMGWLL